MGIEPYLVAATLQGIIAQRLVRKLCDDCAQGAAPDRRAVGCERCARTGYRGRVGIYEYMAVTDEHRAIVAGGGTLAQLQASAKRDGMETLAEAGSAAVSAGVTTNAELLRVVNEAQPA
jgi:general secretion pathway protein E